MFFGLGEDLGGAFETYLLETLTKNFSDIFNYVSYSNYSNDFLVGHKAVKPIS